jgi:hypothetical protein
MVHKERGDGAFWADMAFAIERPRISTVLRHDVFVKLGRDLGRMPEFLRMLKEAEAYVDKTMGEYIVSHPAWPWASRSRGIGKENFPKVTGLIEGFGRYYDVGDLMIPPYVHRAPEDYKEMKDEKVVDRVGIWVAGIERLTTISKLFKYAGEDVAENGLAPKRHKGARVMFNTQLRMANYRLVSSLMRAEGIWYTGGDPDQGYSRGYVGHKQVSRSTLEAKGIKIVPTPLGRMCLECNIEVKRKKAKFCPVCNSELALKTEPSGYFYEGHLDMRAKRLLIKDWLTCLWIVWRTALDLPVSEPYGVRLGHVPIDPWKMVER